MAKVTKVNVEVNYLKSLPNYENVRFTAGAELVVEDKDELNKVYEEAWDIVGVQIEEQLTLFSNNNQAKSKKGL